MIESINFRTGISGTLLRTAQAALAEIPHKFHAPSRKTSTDKRMMPLSVSQTQKVEKNRDRWLVDAELLTVDPQSRISEVDLEFNPRQSLLAGNPRLAGVVTDTIGDRWITHIEDLQQLTPLAEDPLLQSRWSAVKQANKQALASYLARTQGIKIDVNSLFDLQLQPIGGSQRQLLNILHIITLFNQVKQHPELDILPRTFIFGDLGEVEPIEMGKEETAEDESTNVRDSNLAILALIQSLAKILAADIDVNGKLQIVYIPESAALTSQLYAAADLTQHIATAAIEDVDVSKLQAAINGVISIGSLGKTNHWLKQTVGEENCFCFGLAIPEIAMFKEYGYDPYNYYKYYPEIRQAIDYLSAGYFTPKDPSLCSFQSFSSASSLVDMLLGADENMVIAEYVFYAACQSHISEIYTQKSVWTRMSILNVAGVG
ncbi:glycogen/starch/alpha-glucan phosphorylase [Chamaesiphon sp. VAR_48_metabat_135_sub]|uniref:glycogen/starch/alpha-glucan phosphorylase n=1 Tax=Chamaesiphon sp. VAR_48_metabat_135_sub TaxID=2964699 RepID=UPI00286C046B|nr:glycogen/starch/alpha-glucan phosphorylase [Chamaesiphon sp. VAR_48_metabat_135_sub]